MTRTGLPLALTLFAASCATATAQPKPNPADPLIEALKTAPDEHTATAIELRLEQTWLRQGSPAVTLLISRGLRLLKASENQEAIDSFSDAIILQPDVAEAWHQRAIARYHDGDVNGAIHDLEETIQREPRDFAAWRSLADIATAREDWKGAYAAWQKVMELDPKTPNGETRLRELKRKAEGENT